MNNCLLWCSYVAWFSEISLTFFVEYIIYIFLSALPYTEAIFKAREVKRILKAIAKQAANQENERKLIEAKKKAKRKTDRKAYLKRKKAKEEKAAKEKARRGY